MNTKTIMYAGCELTLRASSATPTAVDARRLAGMLRREADRLDREAYRLEGRMKATRRAEEDRREFWVGGR